MSEYWKKFGEDAEPPVLSYLCGKMEKCPKTKKDHYQGWVQFTKKKRLTAILKMFPAGQFHWLPCNGTEAENEAYCQKSATQVGPFESFGSFSIEKKGTAKGRKLTDIKNGATTKELWENHGEVMLMYYRGAEQTQMYLQNKDTNKADFKLKDFPWEPLKWGIQRRTGDQSLTWVLAGAAGIGKTEFAMAHFDNPFMSSNLNDLKLFSPKEHDGIIFDDYDAQIKAQDRETQTHLVENKLDKNIRVLYGWKKIPGGTKKIFTTNREDGGMFEPTEAIARRHRVRILERFEFTADEPSDVLGEGPVAGGSTTRPTAGTDNLQQDIDDNIEAFAEHADVDMPIVRHATEDPTPDEVPSSSLSDGQQPDNEAPGVLVRANARFWGRIP